MYKTKTETNKRVESWVELDLAMAWTRAWQNLTIKLISDLNAKHDIEKLCNKWSDDECQYQRWNRKGDNKQYTKKISFSIWDDKVIVTCKIGLWWSYQSLDEKQECKVFRKDKWPNIKMYCQNKRASSGKEELQPYSPSTECNYVHSSK